ncbi:MAG: hypothetical protein ACI4F1_04225 [Bariatricus sp.]
MKSKVLKTIGLVAAMVACVGMTVFAAPSPSASTVVTGARSDKAEVTISEVTAEDQAVIAEIKTEEGLKAVLGDDFNENMTVAAVINVSVPEGTEFPIDITFDMKGVTASTKGIILHYNGSEWEKIPTTIAEGTMTGTFTSLCPVAFVVDKTTLASGTATSPKTSASAVSAVAVLGLAALTGVCGLKKKEN